MNFKFVGVLKDKVFDFFFKCCNKYKLFGIMDIYINLIC